MKTDIYETITNQIVEALENVDLKNFQSCFTMADGGLPTNAVTGAQYRGVNILTLWVAAQQKRFTSNIWASFNQWKQLGASVKKGQKAANILLYKNAEKIDKETGEVSEYMLARSYAVFNADQVEGWTPQPIDTQPVIVDGRNETIENFISATGAVIVEDTSAFYRPSTDAVHMPSRSQFVDFYGTAAENYYSVLFHELAHWTKASHRCDRKFEELEPRDRYAAEELVAELSAAFLCGMFGIKQAGRDDHAMYIKSWLEALKNDKKHIFKAASLAQKAVDHLKSYSEGSSSLNEKKAA